MQELVGCTTVTLVLELLFKPIFQPDEKLAFRTCPGDEATVAHV